jgi:hypothetical protein
MTEVVKSYRIEASLAEELTRRAEAKGETLSNFVARTLREIGEGNVEATVPTPGAIDLEDLRSEMKQLGGLFRSERLIQAEIVDSLMALSKLARQLEREREETVKVISEAVAGLKEAKVALKEMVDLGSLVDKKCRESSASMEALRGSIQASGSRLQSFLGSLETLGGACEQAVTKARDEVSKTLKKGTDEMAEMWKSNKASVEREARTYASEVFSSTRGAFVFGAWALILIAVVVLGFFAYQYITAPKQPSYGAQDVPNRVLPAASGAHPNGVETQPRFKTGSSVLVANSRMSASAVASLACSI